MNLETRKFIWGLILIILCGFSTAIHILNFVNGTFEHGIWWNWILFIMSLVGTISGWIKIDETTN